MKADSDAKLIADLIAAVRAEHNSDLWDHGPSERGHKKLMAARLKAQVRIRLRLARLRRQVKEAEGAA